MSKVKTLIGAWVISILGIASSFAGPNIVPGELFQGEYDVIMDDGTTKWGDLYILNDTRSGGPITHAVVTLYYYNGDFVFSELCPYRERRGNQTLNCTIRDKRVSITERGGSLNWAHSKREGGRWVRTDRGSLVLK